MSTPRRALPFYWDRHTEGDGKWRRTGTDGGAPPGADLAKLRRGLGRTPGDVPEMWRFHVTMNQDGVLTRWFVAEHHALTLFGLHQQSQARPMHRTGVGLGTAVRALRDKDATPARAEDGAKTSPKWDRVDPVDRRLSAAATAGSRHELILHLRGLITRLRDLGQGLDYNSLCQDLARWEDPEAVAAIRRRWGMQYFVDRTNNMPSTAATSQENK